MSNAFNGYFDNTISGDHGRRHALKGDAVMATFIQLDDTGLWLYSEEDTRSEQLWALLAHYTSTTGSTSIQKMYKELMGWAEHNLEV